MRKINELHRMAQEGKVTLRGARGSGRKRNNKSERVDKVSKSNLAICEPISTATLCVCSEQFVSFGTGRLFSLCQPLANDHP